jgi:hypothetical protein
MLNRTQMIERLQGTETRSPRQDELLTELQSAQAGSERTDALDRDWRERQT